MPDTKFQIVINPDDGVEMFVLIDGVLRRTEVDLRDAPIAMTAFADEAVKLALKAWMLAARAPAWIDWVEAEAALLEHGVDVPQLIARHPMH